MAFFSGLSPGLRSIFTSLAASKGTGNGGFQSSQGGQNPFSREQSIFKSGGNPFQGQSSQQRSSIPFAYRNGQPLNSFQYYHPFGFNSQRRYYPYQPGYPSSLHYYHPEQYSFYPPEE